MTTYYLNNSGSRFIVTGNDGKKIKVFINVNGQAVERTALFFETFGQFCAVFISYNGEKVSTLRYTTDIERLFEVDDFNKVNPIL